MDMQEQISMLSNPGGGPSFAARLTELGLYPFYANTINILQLNITRRCNISCKHCHVDAGPTRTECMSRANLTKCLAVAGRPEITTIDITGGAPETHIDLPWFIEQTAALGKRLIVRSNLVIWEEKEYRHFPEFFAKHAVEVVGSLPDYRQDRTDRLRGDGNFERSIQALWLLNELGYGREGTGLILNLMHNPAGAYPPGNQAALEHEYKTKLLELYGIHFNTLLCLTNSPVGRYLDYLIRTDNYADYMNALQSGFNPSAAVNAMCRTTLSVGWDGALYDCDFNQMLGLSVNHGAPSQLEQFDYNTLNNRAIVVNNHCYACTAGAGSSCQGSTDGASR
ncbi:MAG: radical SAM/Cys-rich domain protein [Chitinivibrionales bacterium]|nr:radical SAM/Cys-rich domain protein [Chitinivibrionales bacterium]MBD3358974.1 radical SAM/Cys-rich domain protein [Chitinivibrionales bacterium]